MADFGIKVSLPNKNITSSDARDYVLWSKYKTLKTYMAGTASYTMPNEAKSQTCFTIATITHNLGYKPIVFFYWQTGSSSGGDFWATYAGSPQLAYSSIVPNAATNHFAIEYFYDNLGGDGNTGLSGTTWNFRYYIFIETANI